MLLSAGFLLIVSSRSRFALTAAEKRCRREGDLPDDAGLEAGMNIPSSLFSRAEREEKRRCFIG